MEKQMDALLEAVQLGRACRNAANLKVRQPLAKMYVKGASFDKAYQELCEDELNVQEVVFTEDARAFTTYKLKPQMRTLGPKYGKLLGKIGQKLGEMDGNDVVDAFARGEEVSFMIDDTQVTLAKDDVLTEPMQKPGFMAMEDKGVTVVLDTNLTEDLIREGYAREVISKLQTMRKEAGFEVTDRINVTYTCDDDLAAAVEAFREMITRTTLALSLERGDAPEGAVSREWDINGRKAVLGVQKNA
jgi:isoleucyl-tRNA synthetase